MNKLNCIVISGTEFGRFWLKSLWHFLC